MRSDIARFLGREVVRRRRYAGRGRGHVGQQVHEIPQLSRTSPQKPSLFAESGLAQLKCQNGPLSRSSPSVSAVWHR